MLPWRNCISNIVWVWSPRAQRATAVHFLEQHGLTQLFDTVVASDDVRRLKPHPEPVQLAAANLGLEPAACVMVGDTTVDIHAAHAAGARSVAVLCGFGSERELSDADSRHPFHDRADKLSLKCVNKL